MSAKGNCYDNAAVKTFFKKLKSKMVGRTVFHTREQGKTKSADRSTHSTIQSEGIQRSILSAHYNSNAQTDKLKKNSPLLRSKSTHHENRLRPRIEPRTIARTATEKLRCAGCEKIFEEKRSSGKGSDRPQLVAALDFVREGDAFYITKLDRLARSLGYIHMIRQHTGA